jgi:hypothetical protein
MIRYSTSHEGPPGEDHEVERHLKTISVIEADLAKQFPTDFPDDYFRENCNMDRLFMLWYFKFSKQLADLLEQDLHSNNDKSLVCRYEKTKTDEERQLLLDETKRYKDALRLSLKQSLSRGRILL